MHVQLFESQDKLGGHANTVNVAGVDVDIGFMVFNNDNYPNMCKWFASMGVEEEDSDMSSQCQFGQGHNRRMEFRWPQWSLCQTFATCTTVLLQVYCGNDEIQQSSS